MNRKSLTTLHDALAYQLSAMYDAEVKLKENISDFQQASRYPLLREEFENYAEQTSNKITKLERIFNYLMEEPAGRKNEVIDKLLEETQRIIRHTGADTLRDIMLTSCMQSINYYKIGAYSSARILALEMEIDTVSDLLDDILSWEKQMRRKLDQLVMEEVLYPK